MRVTRMRKSRQKLSHLFAIVAKVNGELSCGTKYAIYADRPNRLPLRP